MVKMDLDKNGYWPEFNILCDLTLNKVIPRLLEPLQSGGRSIKPCLIHGDLWDENTATDMSTGEPFVFDAGSMYGTRKTSFYRNCVADARLKPTMNMRLATGGL